MSWQSIASRWPASAALSGVRLRPQSTQPCGARRGLRPCTTAGWAACYCSCSSALVLLPFTFHGLPSALRARRLFSPPRTFRVQLVIPALGGLGASTDPGVVRSGRGRPAHFISRLCRKQKLLVLKRTSTVLGGGLSGPEVVDIATVDQLTLGQIAFHQVPVTVPRTWSLDCGLRVLSRFRMTIDFPHDRVDVLPIPAAVNMPFRKDHSGLGVRRLSVCLQILHVAPGSPAEAAGLEVGDEIIAINGEALGAEYFKMHPSMGGRPLGTTLDLTLASGTNMRLVLAEYF